MMFDMLYLQFMFLSLFGFFALLFGLLFSIIIYVLAAYVLTRVGRKFGVGSLAGFLIPIYNIVLLCDCAKISRWVTAGIVLRMFTDFGGSIFGWLITLVFIASSVYIWGKIAERLGKNFWLWGLLTTFLCWFPAVILAFDSSMPSRAARTDGEGQETIYIEL